MVLEQFDEFDAMVEIPFGRELEVVRVVEDDVRDLVNDELVLVVVPIALIILEAFLS